MSFLSSHKSLRFIVKELINVVLAKVLPHSKKAPLLKMECFCFGVIGTANLREVARSPKLHELPRQQKASARGSVKGLLQRQCILKGDFETLRLFEAPVSI